MTYFIGYLIATMIALFILEARTTPVWWYCFRVWIALDQFFNAAVFFGNEDHTISGHAGRRRKEGSWFWTVFANVIDWVALKAFDDRNHCNEAIENDEAGRQYNFSNQGRWQLGLLLCLSFALGFLFDIAITWMTK